VRTVATCSLPNGAPLESAVSVQIIENTYGDSFREVEGIIGNCFMGRYARLGWAIEKELRNFQKAYNSKREGASVVMSGRSVRLQNMGQVFEWTVQNSQSIQ